MRRVANAAAVTSLPCGHVEVELFAVKRAMPQRSKGSFRQELRNLVNANRLVSKTSPVDSVHWLGEALDEVTPVDTGYSSVGRENCTQVLGFSSARDSGVKSGLKCLASCLLSPSFKLVVSSLAGF